MAWQNGISDKSFSADFPLFCAAFGCFSQNGPDHVTLTAFLKDKKLEKNYTERYLTDVLITFTRHYLDTLSRHS